MKRYPLLIAGAALWALAWFMPVVAGEATLADGKIPGWQAFRVSLSPIWPYDNPSTSDPFWFNILGVASGLSNFILIGALLAARRAGRTSLLWKALFGCGLLNTLWLLSEGRGDFRVGYYLWVSSYFVLAVALRSGVRIGQENRVAAV